MKNTSTHLASKKMVTYMAMTIVISLGFNSVLNAQEGLMQKERGGAINVADADTAVLAGIVAYAQKDYENAVILYKKAINFLPQGPIAADRRKAYMAYFVDGSIALSNHYRKIGKDAEANETLNKVIAIDPKNVLVKKELKRLNDLVRKNPAPVDINSIIDLVGKVRNHIYRGHSYLDQEEFDYAMIEFKKVIRIDPQNKAALRGVDRVNEAKGKNKISE